MEVIVFTFPSPNLELIRFREETLFSVSKFVSVSGVNGTLAKM